MQILPMLLCYVDRVDASRSLEDQGGYTAMSTPPHRGDILPFGHPHTVRQSVLLL